MSFQLRPGDQGYATGVILFQDQSTLHFREYLDDMAGHVSKLMYSYHYQDADEQLVFRYDNARHRPALPFLDHKHTFDEVLPARAPTLDAVLTEIVSARKWA